MARPGTKINQDNFGRQKHKSTDKLREENQAKLKRMEQELSLENDALNYINQLSKEQEIRRAELRELMTSDTPAWNNREAIDAKMKEIISIEGSLRTARDYYSLYENVPELSPVEEEKTVAKQEEKAESKEYALYTLEDEERLMQQEAEEARIKAEIDGLPKTPSIDEFSQEDDFTKEERQSLTDARYGQFFEKYENGTLNNEEYQEFVSLQENIMSDLNPNYKNEPAKEEVKETNEVSETTMQPQEQVKVEEKEEALEMPPISQEELDGLLGKTDIEESKSETDYDIEGSFPELEDEDTNDLGQDFAESPLEELPTVDVSDYDEEIEGVGNPENLGVEIEEETETYAPPEMEDEAEGVHFDPDESLNVAPQSFEEEQSQENEEEESGKGFLGAMKGAAKTVGAGFATVGQGIATGVKTVGGGIAKGTMAVGTGIATAGLGVANGAKKVAGGVVKGTKFVGREALNVLGKDRGERIRNALILGGLAYVAYKQYQNGNAISNLTGVTKDGFADVKNGMSNLSAKVQAGTRQVMAQALRNKEAVLKVADQVTSLESITKENGSKLDGLGKQVSRNSRALGRIEPKVNDVYGYVQGQKELDKKILEEMLRNSRQAGDLVADGR